jgi:SAM-dependent methyltransferase
MRCIAPHSRDIPLERVIMPTGHSQRTIPPETYTRDYYEANCHGYTEFQHSRGEVIPDRLKMPLDLAGSLAGKRVLDVGCGRGEVLLHATRRGAQAFGFDYAVAAVEIAAGSMAGPLDSRERLIHLANAQRLPYPSGRFDVAFMLDVVEHLYPAELHQALIEIRRVLKPGGCLIVHTMPNTWYYRFGYPAFRVVQGLRRRHQPSNPRDRWRYKEVHVNEQNPIRLQRSLSTAGFRAKVWLQSIHTYAEEPNRWVRWAMRALVTLYPFRWIFCNDLFAVATKE